MMVASRGDELLIQRLKGGSLDALAELYERHARGLYQVAYRLLRTSEDAEDVVHDVFLALPDLVLRYEERGSLDAWLARVCVRTALSRLRTRRSRHTVSLEETVVISSREENENTRLNVHDAISKLPDSLRVVFMLKVVEGYSHAEISRLLGISAKASDVRLSRAVKRLRVALGET